MRWLLIVDGCCGEAGEGKEWCQSGAVQSTRCRHTEGCHDYFGQVHLCVSVWVSWKVEWAAWFSWHYISQSLSYLF